MPNKRTLTRSTIGAMIASAAIALATVGSAAGAEIADLEVPLKRSHLQPALDAAELRDDYAKAYKKANKLDVAPKRNAAKADLEPKALKRELNQLRKGIKKAQKPKFGTPESVGVSEGTLESIAACESGGDPGAISSTGTYRGKYQFDHSTWASVGGSGDPAAAPEAEQDYRAALLYSRAGSSPWPVCG